MILNTDKGENEFNNISTLLDVFETKYSDILAGNPALVGSSRRPYNRNKFFSSVDKCDNIELLTNKIIRRNLYTRVVNKIYQTVKSGKTTTKDLIDNSTERLIYKIKEGCSGCMSCHSVCHKEAILIKYDNEGFCYPVVNVEKCINCGLCEKVCPQKQGVNI